MTSTRSLLLVALVGTTCLTALGAGASSHREAPGTAGSPRVDGTDFYMFNSYEKGRGKYVTLIANYIPDQSPYAGPNYFTMDNDAIYEIHIDKDGDAVEDLTLQFDFSTKLLGGTGFTLPIGPEGSTVDVAIPLRNYGGIVNKGDATISEAEFYSVTTIEGDRRSGKRTKVKGPNADGTFTKPIDNIGNKSIPDYPAYANQHIYPLKLACGNGKVFVGQRAEAFAVNLGKIFDLVNIVPIQGADNPAWPQYNVGAGAFPGGITQDRANDDLVGKANVTSIAVELPKSCLTDEGNGVIGGWTTASLPQARLLDPSPSYDATTVDGGAYVQVSRLSAPLVNEVVIGLKDKDLFNAVEPTQDGAVATYVTNPTLPALLDILFRDAVGSETNIAPSNFPRNDLVTAFLTGFPGVNQQEIITASEMLRLNTAIPATLAENQNTFGVVAEDLAGFPNGRRPGDDTVDIALRVMMGALCEDLPLGAELGVEGAEENTPSDIVNLGLCAPEDAPVGTAAFTDGAPLNASELRTSFPYLTAPMPGSKS